MSRRHSSDEQILAWLDGELAPRAAQEVENHLRACWSCRGRRWEIEETTRQLAASLCESCALPPGHVERARARFERDSGTVHSVPPRPAQFGRLTWLRAPALLLAGALAVAAGIGIWIAPTHAPAPSTRSTEHPAERPEPRGGNASALAVPPHKAVIEERLPAPAFPPAISPDVEVQALWVLHELELCRGQALDVQFRNGALAIDGVVPSRAIREDLIARVRGTVEGAAVEFHIQSAEDLATIPPHAAAASIEPVRIAALHAPGEAIILRWLDQEHWERSLRHRRMLEISNRAIELSELCSIESWTLRGLDDRFPAPKFARLSPVARQAVESMARDHFGHLRQRTLELEQLLGPAIADAALSGVVPAGLHESTENLRSNIQMLFAPTRAVEEPAEQLAGCIRTALTALSSELSDPARLATDLFAPKPALVSTHEHH
jgi:hypothetical protein